MTKDNQILGRDPTNTQYCKVACLSDCGKVRQENQDTYYADNERGLFLVCDGMGGAHGGTVAAQAAVGLLPTMLTRRLPMWTDVTADTIVAVLKDTIASFSVLLREHTQDDPHLQGMGAALVLALVQGSDVYIAHIGDSRAYLLTQGDLTRVTHDHTLIAVMLALGQMTPEEALRHLARGKLTRYVGMEGEAVADVQRISVEAGITPPPL